MTRITPINLGRRLLPKPISRTMPEIAGTPQSASGDVSYRFTRFILTKLIRVIRAIRGQKKRQTSNHDA